ncbi:uncharacterized protein PSFLO_05084 [Pseudozyma flocculosa]|uniref:Secreted protein n=1 Tax=Pseudozyma flocculosa TaxID=84751 RepID=A0A5C3F521_9BASI|nr:uncharacterized protein PSFLO_05084 [Pseudozyma flocculosa]
MLLRWVPAGADAWSLLLWLAWPAPAASLGSAALWARRRFCTCRPVCRLLARRPFSPACPPCLAPSFRGSIRPAAPRRARTRRPSSTTTTTTTTTILIHDPSHTAALFPDPALSVSLLAIRHQVASSTSQLTTSSGSVGSSSPWPAPVRLASALTVYPWRTRRTSRQLACGGRSPLASLLHCCLLLLACWNPARAFAVASHLPTTCTDAPRQPAC